MNLHFAINDKFIDHFIHYSSKLNTTEDVIVVPTEDKNLKYIKRKDRITQCQPTLQSIYEAIGSLERVERIYIHYLTGLMVDFLNSFKSSKVKIVWIFFGADAFNTDLFLRYTYDDLTKKFFKSVETDRISVISFLKRQYRIYLRRKAISKVTHFAHYIQEDHELVKSKFPNCSAFVEFNHGGFTLFKKNIPDKFVDGKNILVGNSSNPSNNHLEIFYLLKDFEINECNIICPLSYGGEEFYAKEVVERGSELFGPNFQPLLDFMDRESYFNILSSVKIAIMNHNRSQAGGNILSLIWMGKYVFMKKDNTFYKFIKSLGVQIFDLESDLDRYFTDSNFPQMDIQKNRVLIMDYFNEERSLEFYKKLLSV